MKKQISNEQLAMSNGGARQRNSKLLLLIASCSLLITGGGEAGAAKMCAVKLSTTGKSWAVLDHFFIIGDGCGNEKKPINTFFGNVCASKYAVGVWSCGLADQTTQYECNCRIVWPYTTRNMRYCTGRFNDMAVCEERCELCCANAFYAADDNIQWLMPGMESNF
ncbi:MAG: hypothetical protein LBL46_02605 [Rickettsiales bacterium]|nr:hypothetical protein [Rickettsiales bacterium]